MAVNTENYCGTSCIDVGEQSDVVVYLMGGTCVQACSGATPDVEVTSSELTCVDCSTASGLLTYAGTIKYCAASCSMIAKWTTYSIIYTDSQVCYDSCSGVHLLVGSETYCGSTCNDIGTQLAYNVYMHNGAC